MKTALVLEGGAMRGMYTAGVLDVLIEAGAHFDGVIGVSAGALFGMNFLSGQKGRALRYNQKYNSDRNYMGLRPLLREGNIVSTDYAYSRVPFVLDPFDNEKFKKNPTPFYAVMTNIVTGKPEYKRIACVPPARCRMSPVRSLSAGKNISTVLSPTVFRMTLCCPRAMTACSSCSQSATATRRSPHRR